MTEEKQRAAIAEACGWRRDYFDEDNGTRRDFWRNPKNENDIWSVPPNYLNDLNAMNEAEKSLTVLQTQHYIPILRNIAAVEGFWPETAAPKYRAKAFLATLNLWES